MCCDVLVVLYDEIMYLLTTLSEEPVLRIAKLYNELRNDKSRAILEFWSDVVRMGSPLIESHPDSSKVNVTFVWRGKNAKNIVVFGDFGGSHRPIENMLVQIKETDVWYKTYVLPSDSIIAYHFAIDYPLDSLLGTETKPLSRHELIPDPFNIHYLDIPPDSEDENRKGKRYSVAYMPNAKTSALANLNLADSMETEMLRIPDPLYPNGRRIWIHKPLLNGKPFPSYHVVVLFDGWVYTKVIMAQDVINTLVHLDRIAPTLIIAIDIQDRQRELRCNTQTVSLVCDTVLPLVALRHKIALLPQTTVIGGLSLGGLSAAFVGLRRQSTIGSIFCQSGSFWWKPGDDEHYEWITREYSVYPVLPLNFYVEAGLLETSPTGGELKGPSILHSNRNFARLLIPISDE